MSEAGAQLWESYALCMPEVVRREISEVDARWVRSRLGVWDSVFVVYRDFSFPRNRSWHLVGVREMVIAGLDPFSGAQKNAHNGQQQKEEFSGLCYVT